VRKPWAIRVTNDMTLWLDNIIRKLGEHNVIFA
jgi:hypothetical protein